MEDRRLEVLTQYGFTVIHHYSARGALLLETDEGLKLLRSCTSGEQRLEFEAAVKGYIVEHGGPCTDTVCRTTEGKLLSENSYGDKFCIRDWKNGEECCLKQENHCLTAVDTLVMLQKSLKGFTIEDTTQIYQKPSLPEQFIKRTRELKRVRSYIRDKKQKSEFEVLYLKLCDRYYEQALEAMDYMQKLLVFAGAPVRLIGTEGLCHGNFTYHSLLECPPEAGEPNNSLFFVTSFDKAVFGLQVTDFYYLLRKTMEKNDWLPELGHKMIDRYFAEKDNADSDLQLLRGQLIFPEKFWKITNYYYNNRKSWIPRKNIQKMFANHDREPLKEEFLRTLN